MRSMIPAEVRASYLVGRVDRLVRSAFEEVLADFGLTVTEFTALSVLASKPGLSNARLARRTLVTPQAMHKVMRALEQRDLVGRTSAPGSGRTLAAELTQAGQDLLVELQPSIQAAEDRLLSPLARNERAELVRLLGLVSGLDRSGP